MKAIIDQLTKVLVYMVTPEDSTRMGNSVLSFGLSSRLVSLGSFKALFWVFNSMVILYLITLL